MTTVSFLLFDLYFIDIYLAELSVVAVVMTDVAVVP